MMQSLHILRKDLRHQATVLIIYANILLVFAIIAPQVRPGLVIKYPALTFLASLLNVLIPLAWFAITARVIHDEPLVGDRQFWITRPYNWQSLLAAKTLFLVLALWLPFLVMQCILALYAGLNPFNQGMFASNAMTLLYVWLPSFLIATIASTLPPAFFTALATLVLWGTLFAFLIGRDQPRTDAPWSFTILGIIFAVLMIAILIAQYRKRHLRTTRIALLASIAFFFVFYAAYVQMPLQTVGNALMHAHYRNSASSLHLVYDTASLHTPVQVKASANENRDDVTLPIHLDGLDQDARLIDLNATFTIDAGAEHYTSPWRPVMLTQSLGILIPHDLLKAINTAGTPAHVSINLVGSILAPSNTETGNITDRFSIGPHSVCDRIMRPGNHFRCNFAYQVADPVRIEPIPEPGCTQTAFAPSDAPTQEPIIGADPIRVEVISLAEGTRCNIASFRATTYHRSKTFNATLDIPALYLDGLPH